MPVLDSTLHRPETEVLRTVPFLKNAPPAVIDEFARAAIPYTYSAGECIFMEGEPGAGLHLIASGTVKVSRYSSEGREHILHIFQRGDTFNEVSALDGGPNPATAVAMDETSLWRVERDALRRIAERHPEFAWTMIENLAKRARYLVGVVQDLSMRSVRGRLARLLLDQATNNADAPPLALTQEEMASRLGTVREVVGRALRSLAAAGVIEFDRHRIVVLDPHRLAEEAEV
jgi:CRP/FNR family cyclic AMP-dependent transcriptional regulator